jgi:serine/threonine protein kinase
MRHPVTQGLVGWVPSGDANYAELLLEWMPNDSLDAVTWWMHKGRPPAGWDATARSKAVLGIVAGMAFMHSLGLVHESLDPIHILLDAAFEVRLASFRCSAPAVFRMLPSKPHYRFQAPEYCARPSRHCTNKVDVYAFAITLYSLWVPIPLEPESGVDVRAPPPPGRPIPPFYWDLITRCWDDDPERRPSFADLQALFGIDRRWVFPGTDESALAAYAAKFDVGWIWTDPGWRLVKSKKRKQRPLSKLTVKSSNYTRKDVIGRGSFGVVYRAREQRTGELVALKQLHAKWMNENDQELFLREIEVLSAFDYPALIGFRGFCLFPPGGESGPVILTELANGGSLEALINSARDGRAPPDWTDTRKLIVLYGIASGMRVLHVNRVFHRDLKPGNVLLTEALEPKIADFGSAKRVAVGATPEQSATRGTLQYMAPEVHTSLNYGFPADVYAFGVIAYAVLTGLPVFPNLTEYQVGKLVTEGNRPPIPDSLPLHYRTLIEECWSHAPADRPAFDAIVPRLESPEFISSVDERGFGVYQTKLLKSE